MAKVESRFVCIDRFDAQFEFLYRRWWKAEIVGNQPTFSTGHTSATHILSKASSAPSPCDWGDRPLNLRLPNNLSEGILTAEPTRHCRVDIPRESKWNK